VVDEAYFEFSGKESAVTLMESCPRLVVMRTFSKSWGLANARVGMAIASKDIVDAMNKVKYPYNMSGVAQELAIEVLSHSHDIMVGVQKIVEQREIIAERLKAYTFVLEVYPSDANFLLVRVNDPNELYNYLRDRGIVIRNRSTVRGCDGCVRITIGSAIENQKLLDALNAWEENV
jgi:histidinol-phosphate aminotransferase